MTAHDQTFAAIAQARFHDLCVSDFQDLHRMAHDGDLRHVNDHGPGAFWFTLEDDSGLSASASHNDLDALAEVAIEALSKAKDGITFRCEHGVEEAIAASMLTDKHGWGFEIEGDGSILVEPYCNHDLDDGALEFFMDLIAESQALHDHVGRSDIRMTTEAAFYATGIAAQ